MNTIDNVPNREPAERFAEPDNPDNGTPANQGHRTEALSGFSGTATRHLDDADVAAEVCNEQDKPIPIDGDDKDPTPGVNTRTLRQPSSADHATEPEKGDAKNEETNDSADSKAVVPQSLAKRYLIAENKFYFRDDPNLVAFEDKGKRLSTEHNDPQVAQSMVELAQAKNWNSIKVKGAVEFRREVWLAASLRGIDIQGYEPRAVDKARLAELRSEFVVRHQNSIELGIDRENAMAQATTGPTAESNRPHRTDKPEPAEGSYRNLTKQQRVAVDTLRAILTERGDSAHAVEMAANLASKRFHQHRVYVGRLVRHGPAPYEHKPDEKMNYFVTLKTPNGEQTIWGVDLARAVPAADAKAGDDLALVHQGKKKVSVLALERDAAGKPTGKEVEIVADRNFWDVRPLDKMREEAQVRVRAAAEQTAQNQPEVRVYDVPSQPQRQAAEPIKTLGREQAPTR
jgi:hypothetical protein